MSLIVKTVSRLTFGLILLFGVYVSFHGHLSPGGGFAGGVILALAFASLMLAYGKETALKKLSQPLASFFEGLGGMVFISLAVLGFLGGYFFVKEGVFFKNILGTGTPFALFSAGMIPLYNIAAIALEVAAGLFSVFTALVLLKVDKGEKK